MNTSYDKNGAIVVLPSASGGNLHDRSLRAWLARSDLSRPSGASELLARVLTPLDLPMPKQGLAALRLWGQTGDCPTMWIAAADPVYLEPRMDHLCLHALRRDGVPAAEMGALVDHLQATLSDDSHLGFIRLESYCYVSSKSPFATACSPAYVVDQQQPDAYLPSGENSAAHRNLLSEIEMSLHEHPVNLARLERGEQAVNSLWLWGGGTAPEHITRPQPPLFSDDALLTGYWNAATAVAEPWPGSIKPCLDSSVAGFVAATPEFDDSVELLEQCLLELHDALMSQRLSSLTLLFRDGLMARIERKHRRRFWRRKFELFDL